MQNKYEIIYIYLVLLLIPKISMAFKGFDELNTANCTCKYSFLISDTINKSNPLYLEIINKKETVKLEDSTFLSIIEVKPYINNNNNIRKYFYYSKSNKSISILQNNKEQLNQFQFNIFLYGLNKNDIKSIHINNMPLPVNNLWSGMLSKLNYYVSLKTKNVKKVNSKWFKQYKGSVDNNSFNCSCAIFFEKINEILKNSIVVKHKNGIIGIHDIFLFDDLNKSIKDKFVISPKSDETFCIATKDNNMIGKQIVLDLWLKSKSRKAKFYFKFKPENIVKLDDKELLEKYFKALCLKFYNHNNFPLKISRENIEISNFTLDNKVVDINKDAYIKSELIVLKDKKSVFFKGQKLSFKIIIGNYFPTICHHVVSDNPNIIIHLTKAPVPFELENLVKGFSGVVVTDERGQKPIGTINLFDKNTLIKILTSLYFYKTEKSNEIKKIIFYGNDLYGKSEVTVYPDSDNNIVHLFLPRLYKKIWVNIKDKHTQKKLPDINFSLINNNRKYDSTSESLIFPVYVNETFQVEIDSERYITACDQNSIFKCENNFNSCPGFSAINPINFEVEKKVNIRPEIKLICKINGDKKDVYYDGIDEEIKIHIWRTCLHKEAIKKKQMKYNNEKKSFIVSLPCPVSKKDATIEVMSEKFDMLKKDLKRINKTPIEIEMKLNKPVLYMLINPSEEILRGPLHKSKIGNFKKITNRFYETMSYLDNTRPWENFFSYNHFFVRYSNKIEQLIKPGIIKPKWDDQEVQLKIEKNIKPEFGKSSVAYQKIIDEAVLFVNNYSISDNIALKGVILIVSACSITPLTTEMIDKIQNTLHKMKMGAVIARFGIIKDNEYYYTSDIDKYNNITVVEYNLNIEFNKDYLSSAFKKIRKELWKIINRNGVNIGHLYE